MTHKEQTRFIRELCANAQKDILSKVHKHPDTWDGHELRQLLADTFERYVLKGTMSGKRLKEYKNTVILENL